MWKFSGSNSSYTLWPPDAVQQHKPISFCPNFVNNNGHVSLNAGEALPGFGSHQSSVDLNSVFTHQLNPQAFSPPNGSLGMGVLTSKGCLGAGFTTQIKRFLIFDQSGDRTNLIFSSVGNPQLTVSPILPTTNKSYAYASDCHETDENEEMHEDTDEIDALLYSDSENSNDMEEASTGHSPLVMEEVEEVSSPIPSKRRKLEHSDIDTFLTDTASSAVFPGCHFVIDANAELSYAYSGSKLEDNTGDKTTRSKRERIQTTVNLLRRIIPDGKGKDTAAVLDDAIRYLKSLKLQAEALDCSLD